ISFPGTTKRNIEHSSDTKPGAKINKERFSGKFTLRYWSSRLGHWTSPDYFYSWEHNEYSGSRTIGDSKKVKANSAHSQKRANPENTVIDIIDGHNAAHLRLHLKIWGTEPTQRVLVGGYYNPDNVFTPYNTGYLHGRLRKAVLIPQPTEA